MRESKRDGKLYLYYEITSRQTLESMYEKKVMSYQDILSILSGIRDTLEDMRKYLLSPQKLLFAPELIYVLPEKGGLLLCYYAKEDEYPITMLAEFILKRLDHRDRQAVALGYGFFQQANSVNFSLAKALKEIFAVSGEDGRKASARPDSDRQPAMAAGQDVSPVTARPGNNSDISKSRAGYETGWRKEQASGMVGTRRSVRNEPGLNSRIGGVADGLNSDYPAGQNDPFIHSERDPYGKTAESFPDMREPDEDEIPVTHRERKKKKEPPDLADRLFAKIHPAVMLSFLLLMIGLELALAFGVFGLTEAGGCFFLMMTTEILVNRKVLRKDSPKMQEWEDDENEEYEKIMREVYQPEDQAEPEPIEETRCLIQDEGEGMEEICLICTRRKEKEEWQNLPDIHPGTEPLYIGKIKGEADIILHSATVSRMHARIQVRDGKCFLKDMSSKNGTFVNGERLTPQEEREIKTDDIVSFAEIEYRVVNGKR